MTSRAFPRMLAMFVLLAGFAAKPSAPSASPKPVAPSGPAGASKPTPAAASDESRRATRRAPLQGFDVPQPAGSKPTRATAGASRGGNDEPLVLLAPAHGRLCGQAPLFQWQASAKSGPYLVEILDEAAKPVVRESVDGTEFTPPIGAEGLEPGKTYSWSVSLPSPGRPRSASAYVEVLPASEQDAIEKALAAKGSDESYETLLARARVFRERRLWYDAVGAYSEAIGKFPERQAPYEERGQIYFQLAVTKPLAERDFAKSDALAKQAH